MKLKYLLVACAALFVSTQSLAAKPSDESAMKWLEIQGISSNYSEKVQRSLEMVNKEDNERLLTMTPKAQKAQMKAVISRYMKNMQDDLSRPELKKQWLDEEKRAVQKVFTQEEVDVTNFFLCEYFLYGTLFFIQPFFLFGSGKKYFEKDKKFPTAWWKS